MKFFNIILFIPYLVIGFAPLFSLPYLLLTKGINFELLSTIPTALIAPFFVLAWLDLLINKIDFAKKYSSSIPLLIFAFVFLIFFSPIVGDLRFSASQSGPVDPKHFAKILINTLITSIISLIVLLPLLIAPYLHYKKHAKNV